MAVCLHTPSDLTSRGRKPLWSTHGPALCPTVHPLGTGSVHPLGTGSEPEACDVSCAKTRG